MALTNNQLSSFGYDAAGNMTSNGTASYVYDAENRLIATAGSSYIYDGNGERVEKCTEGTTPGTCSSGATGTLYWRFLGGEPLTETNLAGTVQNTYVFFSGQRVARVDSAGAVHYYFSDQLGSHGVVETVSAGGAVSCDQDIDYYPYGGLQYDYCGGSGVAQNYKFTGKERDAESGLDYFGARYYASNMGRMMSPDWSAKVMPVPYAKLGNPQSLNLYAYVGNNPLRYTDPTGHYLVNCAGNDKGCNKGIDNFEKQRQKDLKSKDATVRAGAAAWGDKGADNGVSVTFKTQAQVNSDAGNTDPTKRVDGFVTPGVTADYKPNITAEFSESLGGSDLGQTVAHEGTHVGDDMNFINSYNPATGTYNAGFNMSHGDAEFRAFEAGAGVQPYSMFSPGPKGYQQLLDYIYNGPYKGVADQPLFPSTFPTAYPQ